MNKTVLQVPLSAHLKNSAEEIASQQGFSSLQEVVRVFLTKFAEKKMEIFWQEPIYLSDSNEKRYSEMTEDFNKNKNIFSTDSIDTLLNQLNDDKVS